MGIWKFRCEFYSTEVPTSKVRSPSRWMDGSCALLCCGAATLWVLCSEGCLGGEARKRHSYVGEGDVVHVGLHSSSQSITAPRLIWSKKLPEESSVDIVEGESEFAFF